jgi:hypothetical protein
MRNTANAYFSPSCGVIYKQIKPAELTYICSSTVLKNKWAFSRYKFCYIEDHLGDNEEMDQNNQMEEVNVAEEERKENLEKEKD